MITGTAGGSAPFQITSFGGSSDGSGWNYRELSVITNGYTKLVVDSITTSGSSFGNPYIRGYKTVDDANSNQYTTLWSATSGTNVEIDISDYYQICFGTPAQGSSNSRLNFSGIMFYP